MNYHELSIAEPAGIFKVFGIEDMYGVSVPYLSFSYFFVASIMRVIAIVQNQLASALSVEYFFSTLLNIRLLSIHERLALKKYEILLSIIGFYLII